MNFVFAVFCNYDYTYNANQINWFANDGVCIFTMLNYVRAEKKLPYHVSACVYIMGYFREIMHSYTNINQEWTQYKTWDWKFWSGIH